jgi:hypothetical protein
MKAVYSLAIAASLLTIGAVYAQDNGARPSFAEMKQRIIERLTSELNCVQAATDEAALRACRPRGRGAEPQTK